MESRELNKPINENQVVLVKKGLFYYLFLPIKLLFKLIIFIIKYCFNLFMIKSRFMKKTYLSYLKNEKFNKVIYQRNNLDDELI